MPGVDALTQTAVREALRLANRTDQPPTGAAARTALRELLGDRDAVRHLLDGAPPGARAAFVHLAGDGPAAVTDLLGRGWWGHGTLPPPLDWLQRRALVLAGADGLVHACDEARAAFRDQAHGAAADPGEGERAAVAGGRGSEQGEGERAAVAGGRGSEQGEGERAAVAGGRGSEHGLPPLRVDAAACVVVAPSPEALDRALTVRAAGLHAVAPTVALSRRSAQAVAAALRAVGLRLEDASAVAARPAAPALPGTEEEAVGPAAVRALLARAVAEGRQLRLRYFASSRGGAATDRVVDAWSFADDLLRGHCHLRGGERSFAVDRIGRARLLPSAVEVGPPVSLD
ncbi:MAG TPA: WYL domain-containing protein [Egibacteraceae bacterium]|nr:WYL domain-containing protein [Egibacteraceae bacterium]